MAKEKKIYSIHTTFESKHYEKNTRHLISVARREAEKSKELNNHISRFHRLF